MSRDEVDERHDDQSLVSRRFWLDSLAAQGRRKHLDETQSLYNQIA